MRAAPGDPRWIPPTLTLSDPEQAGEDYRALGFEEVARSFVGRYELVWMLLPL